MPLEAREEIAKAICSDKWDAATGEISPSLFKGSNSSVSRLAIVPLEETWDVFRFRVEKPPERTLDRIGTISVGDLHRIGANFPSNPTPLTVKADPLDGYPSHAIIPEKISRGLANQIIKGLTIHRES